MAKATRGSTDLKGLITDLCNSEEFLQKIFEHISKNSSKLKIVIPSTQVECIQNKTDIEKLKEENSKLKLAVEKLESEVALLKTKQLEERKNGKTGKIDKKVNVSPTIYADVHTQAKSSSSDMEMVRVPPSTTGTGPSIAKVLDARETPLVEDKEFVRVTKRRRHKIEQKIGAAKEDKSGGRLVGAAHAKTAWFYVGKIKNKDATERDMMNYLAENDKDVDFTVEKLETKGPYAAFKVGAPFDLLNKLNSEEYWPYGVCIRRFNFWDKRRVNKNYFLEKGARPGCETLPA